MEDLEKEMKIEMNKIQQVSASTIIGTNDQIE